MASHDDEITPTEVVLMRKKDIMKSIDSEMQLIGGIKVDPIHLPSTIFLL